MLYNRKKVILCYSAKTGMDAASTIEKELKVHGKSIGLEVHPVACPVGTYAASKFDYDTVEKAVAG